MPPWPQQGPPAPAVTRPTGLDAWLSQHRVTSGGAGASGPGLVASDLGASVPAAPADASSGVPGGGFGGQAATLQSVLAASNYSPRWPPPGPPQPDVAVMPAMPTMPAISRREPSYPANYEAPRTYPMTTTAVPAPQIPPTIYRPNPAGQWPLLRQPLHISAAGAPPAAAPRQQAPVSVDRGAPADAGADMEADELDEVPLVLSDLDPRYQSQLVQPPVEKEEEIEEKAKPKEPKRSKPQVQIPVPAKPVKSAKPAKIAKHPGGGQTVSSAQKIRDQTWQKAAKKAERNGTAKDKSSRKLVAEVPIPAYTPKRLKTTTATPPKQKRSSHETTPNSPTPPSAFSIVIPVATPRASSVSSDSMVIALDSAPVSAKKAMISAGAAATPYAPAASKAPKAPKAPASIEAPAAPVPPETPAGAQKKPPPAPSPVVAVGRRSKTVSSQVTLKGRPKGWKPGMSYREVALRNAGIEGEAAAAFLFPPPRKKQPRRVGEIKETRRRAARSDGTNSSNGSDRRRPNYMLAKRSGRPPPPSMEAVQRAIFQNSPALFVPFFCEWAGCRAELQNMATLRRHVMVVHGRTATTCQWRRCASRVPAVSFLDGAEKNAQNPQTTSEADSDPAPTRMDQFREHMEFHHLAPVEWHQGDGFVNNSHLGPRQPPLSLSTVLAKAKAKAAAASVTGEEAATIAASATGDAAARAEDGHGGEDSGPASPAADAASTAFASYNVPIEDLPRYLLDERGKQVTPLLRDPLFELSTAFPTAEEQARRLRELYRYHIGSRYPGVV